MALFIYNERRDQMDYSQEWVYIISNFGFPIVLSTYLLLRFEKKIDHLGEILDNLRDAIIQRGNINK